MKRFCSIVAVLAIAFSLVLSGCTKKAASGREAIDNAKAMETNEQKVKYLIGQAKAFYNSKEFQEAVNTAQYILRYLDKDNQAAKDLFEKAKTQLGAAAKAAAEDAKKKLGDLGR